MNPGDVGKTATIGEIIATVTKGPIGLFTADLADANKYDLGNLDSGWLTIPQIEKIVKETAELLQVPNGKLLVKIDGIFLVVIAEGGTCKAQYAWFHDTEDRFYVQTDSLEADFGAGDIWLSSCDHLSEEEKEYAARDLYCMAGTALHLVNRALARGYLKPNYNIRTFRPRAEVAHG